MKVWEKINSITGYDETAEDMAMDAAYYMVCPHMSDTLAEFYGIESATDVCEKLSLMAEKLMGKDECGPEKCGMECILKLLEAEYET